MSGCMRYCKPRVAISWRGEETGGGGGGGGVFAFGDDVVVVLVSCWRSLKKLSKRSSAFEGEGEGLVEDTTSVDGDGGGDGGVCVSCRCWWCTEASRSMALRLRSEEAAKAATGPNCRGSPT